MPGVPIAICRDTGFERHLEINSDVLLGFECLMRKGSRWVDIQIWAFNSQRDSDLYSETEMFEEAPVGATGIVELGFGVVRWGHQCHSWL